jgi:hypothetical protein
MLIRKIFFIALFLPISAWADASSSTLPFNTEDEFKTAPFSAAGDSEATSPFSDKRVSWTAMTGFGYDNNAYQVPSSSSTIASGAFVPYEARMEVVKNSYRGSRVLVSGSAAGRAYLLAGLGNEYKLNLSGGTEYIIERDGKSEDTFYVGAILEKDDEVLPDHDTRDFGNTAMHDTDILGRVSYSSFGVESKYKHRLGDIDYGLTADYLLNDYSDPLSTQQLDHSFYALGADVSVPVALQTRWKLSFEHSVRDFSKRYARDSSGGISSSLLLYTYNTFGATILNQVRKNWLLFLDYDHSERTDGNVGYDNCRENRFGARLAFDRAPVKGMIGWHHSKSRYPNAFPNDNPSLPKSRYMSENVLELRVEKPRSADSTVWSQMTYKVRNSDDSRYEYSRMQLMVGISWKH